MDKTDQRLSLNEEVQDEAELYNHLMHIASYRYASGFASGKEVLDYGCGSGYGSYILSEYAAHVTGVDLDINAVKKAGANYKADNLEFKTINDLTGNQFDLIVNFQVIEHVAQVREYLGRLKSFLKPGGVILISTPDSTNRLFKYIQKPWNIYHLKEYREDSFYRLLSGSFKKVEILKIGSENEIVKKEIERTKKLRVITLVCTLFFYPDSVRRFLLHAIATVHSTYRKISKKKHIQEVTRTNANILKNDISFEEIIISKEVKFNTDLLAVCSD